MTDSHEQLQTGNDISLPRLVHKMQVHAPRQEGQDTIHTHTCHAFLATASLGISFDARPSPPCAYLVDQARAS